MTKNPTSRSVGPWASEKLESLRAYLDYYTTVLKNQTWLRGTWFIDAFAGGGLSRVRRGRQNSDAGPSLLLEDIFESPVEPEEMEYLKGSPRVALELANPFTRYVFIEKARDLVVQLEALKVEFPYRSIDVRSGDANVELLAFLARGIDRRTNRGVVFLDPFAMHVPWATVDAVAKTQWLELIVNFPLHMAINRLLTRTAEIPRTWQDRLDSTLGSAEWRDLVYEKQTDLIGDTMAKRGDAALRVLEWYRERLRRAFGHVSPAQLIRNTKGLPLYYLIWAGPHAKGLDGANYILGRKKSGNRRPNFGS
jgi:three-Cys-motif partner protein